MGEEQFCDIQLGEAFHLEDLLFCEICKCLFYNGPHTESDTICFECLTVERPKEFVGCLCCQKPLYISRLPFDHPWLCSFCSLALDRLREQKPTIKDTLTAYLKQARMDAKGGEFIPFDTSALKGRKRIILQIDRKPPEDVPIEHLFPGFFLRKERKWTMDPLYAYCENNIA